MSKITAAEVNKLRKQTGAGMMDCKKALVESDGDFEKAVDYLRKKGQKVAAKRSDREAGEGVVLSKVNDNNTFGAAIMVNCETDFVAKNEDFIAFSQMLLDAALDNHIDSVDNLKALEISGKKVEDLLLDQVGKIGEKIEIGDYQTIEGVYIKSYIHSGNRLATLVEMSKKTEGIDEAGKNIAMQVAAMNPVALNRESVKQDMIDRELEVAKEQIRLEGKPENMVEKIAMGKLNKFFKENTLMSQAYIKDSKINVETYLKQIDKELNVKKYVRLGLS
jgi:elongation factor Ts